MVTLVHKRFRGISDKLQFLGKDGDIPTIQLVKVFGTITMYSNRKRERGNLYTNSPRKNAEKNATQPEN